MTTPTYRFWANDMTAPTPKVLGDLNLNQCSADMTMGAYGNFSGSLPLGQSSAIDVSNLAATVPGKSCLYVQRNSELIWGGIIWSRLYNSDSHSIDLTAQTMDSLFDRIVFANDFVQQGVEQATIFKTAIDRVLAQSANRPPITTASITPTGIPRTILIPAYEFHYLSEVIQELTGDAVGLEYTMTVAPGVSNPDLATTSTTYGSVGTVNVGSTLRLDYPGTVQKYTWPENAFQGGNIFAGRGGGLGNKAPTAVFQIPSPGYPTLWSVYNYPDIIDPNVIKNKTQRESVLDAVPITTPTFDITGDSMTGFWQKLGATVKVDIQDSRFSAGLTATRRLMGWTMKFAGDNNAESITIQTDNGVTA